jgi:hypothetical protein
MWNAAEKKSGILDETVQNKAKHHLGINLWAALWTVHESFNVF